MNTRTHYFLLGLCLALIVPFANAAYASPVGIWDMFGSATVSAVFPDKKSRTSPKASVYHFVQFKEDGAYTTIPWLSTPGMWETLKTKTKYRVSFDPANISGKHLPPFFNDMVNQFSALAEKKFGKAPTLTDFKITSFSDNGQLISNGAMISGTHKMRGAISYTDPASGGAATAQLRITVIYQGLRASAPSNCCVSDDANQNLTDSQAFLAKNKKLAGVKTTKSGLQYKALQTGKGAKPSATSKVTVYYRGILPNGQQFDSNFGGTSAANFAVSGVISGFAEGLQKMQKGSYFRFYIPPNLGYSETGSLPRIKPNSALIFDVQLNDFQ
ncbi:FKBP-type peptidyl-prolyl cis-trans isomerase [Methylomagnum sp.]